MEGILCERMGMKRGILARGLGLRAILDCSRKNCAGSTTISNCVSQIASENSVLISLYQIIQMNMITLK